jgi:hypothetical protein
MVGEFFFLYALFADILFVLFERRVVVLMDLLVRGFSWTLKNTSSWHPFGADTVTKVDVNGRAAFRSGHIRHVFEGGEGAVPVAVSGSALASQPSDQIPVVEIEGDEGLAKEFGSLVYRQSSVVRVIPG